LVSKISEEPSFFVTFTWVADSKLPKPSKQLLYFCPSRN
jgi:hypothetical protein